LFPMQKRLNLIDGSHLSIYLSTQAKAACKIGMLYQRHGDVQLAKKHFEDFFEMARELKDVKMQAVARINIGVVRSMAKVDAKPTSPKSKIASSIHTLTEKAEELK
jgi:hypothetical protein